MKRYVTGVFALLLGASVLGLAPAARAADPVAGSVQVSVLDVSPTTPTAEQQMQPLTFTVSLQNTGITDLSNITVTATRGDPISTQSALSDAISGKSSAQPQFPEPVQPAGSPPVVVQALAPGQSSAAVTIPAASGIPDDSTGLCICADPSAIYPIRIAATAVASDGSTVELGATQTYVPAFETAPAAPTQVTWVWPLLERPHRLTSDTVFIDDDLAKAIAPGGRLDRLLQVAENVDENVAAPVPMTLVVDPELIDELSVMSTGYQVQPAGEPAATRPASTAAGTWLTRLQHLLAAPGMELALTPVANPDVDALTADGLAWSTTMSASMQQRVRTALGGHAASEGVAWPAGGVLSSETAARLAQQGVGTLLLSSSGLRPHTAVSPVLVTTGSASLTAFSAPSTIAPLLNSALSVGGAGTAALPTLVSQLAINSVIDPSTSRDVLMLPPPDLDPDPTAATRTIIETAQTTWSQPLPLLAARASLTATAHANLSDKNIPGLPTRAVETIRNATNSLPALSSIFVDASALGTRLGDLSAAAQRLSSQSWLTSPADLDDAADAITDSISALAGAIRLVKPSSGSYTLGSSDSPLPITLENTTDKTVQVTVTMHAAGGLPGFSASPVTVQIPPGGRLPTHVPVHVDRAGRIKVEVVLLAKASRTDGSALPLGTPLVLSVRSTALGEIGTIIMWGAGVLLAVAFAVRLYRRVRRGPRRGPASGEPATNPEPQPVGSQL